MRSMMRLGVTCLVWGGMTLCAAVASYALDGLTNAAILDLLNVAHMKLEAGDKPGAKTDLKALSARMEDSANPAHKRWRRSLNWITLQITVGYASGADNDLHTLIREVSTADSAPPSPALQQP